ncbi:hypothetical protein E1295_35770 [Nonomuraea mesophila]|uniref:Uncharacterized protein n=1 Tax=Nonomuraea mesophila TaxID=2530382 RepID=A0A4R5EML1_9ACTN|nr:DUF6069 family protein [Nonomuraea mesophila]TDE35814.1 hypothetical protein E1295_35770 [Nonomuraea mesophila]
MSYPSHDRYDRRPSAGPRVNPARVWGGGAAAAVVAALVAVVGVMISKSLLGIRVIAPDGDPVSGSAATTGYAISAAAAALVATLLLFVLMLSTPEPAKFFGWIAGLFAVIITILPFMHSADLLEQIATAAINLVIGIAIASLLTSIGRTALEEAPAPEPYPYEQPRGYDPRGYDQPSGYDRPHYEQPRHDRQGYERPRYEQGGYGQRGYERRDHDPYD